MPLSSPFPGVSASAPPRPRDLLPHSRCRRVPPPRGPRGSVHRGARGSAAFPGAGEGPACPAGGRGPGRPPPVVPARGAPGRAALGPGLRCEESGRRGGRGAVAGAGPGPALRRAVAARCVRGAMRAAHGGGRSAASRARPAGERRYRARNATGSLSSTTSPPRSLVGVSPPWEVSQQQVSTNEVTEQEAALEEEGISTKTTIKQTTRAPSLGRQLAPRRGQQLAAEPCTPSPCLSSEMKLFHNGLISSQSAVYLPAKCAKADACQHCESCSS